MMGLLSGVDPQVLGQVATCTEALFAPRARVRALTRMRPNVNVEVTVRAESFIALIALELKLAGCGRLVFGLSLL